MQHTTMIPWFRLVPRSHCRSGFRRGGETFPCVVAIELSTKNETPSSPGNLSAPARAGSRAQFTSLPALTQTPLCRLHLCSRAWRRTGMSGLLQDTKHIQGNLDLGWSSCVCVHKGRVSSTLTSVPAQRLEAPRHEAPPGQSASNGVCPRLLHASRRAGGEREEPWVGCSEILLCFDSTVGRCLPPNPHLPVGFSVDLQDTGQPV